MALPDVGRCKLCDTNLCTLIIFFKWIFACALSNTYSDSWEKSLQFEQRAEQQRKKKNIRFYKFMMAIPAILHLIITASMPSEPCEVRATISFLATIVYWFSFWYVTHGQEEYRIQSQAWHSGRKRELYSIVCMTEHIKCIVTVISVVEVAAVFTIDSKVLYHVAWFLVTVLQFSSCYFFLNPNVRQLFPVEENQHNELVYMIKP